MLFLANLYFLSSAAAILIPIHFDETHYVRFPVAFSATGSGENIDGFVELQLGLNVPLLMRQRPTTQVPVNGFSATQSSEIFRVNFEDNDGLMLDMNTRTICFASTPAFRFPSSRFMVYPTSDSEGVLEIDPENPESRALDNQLFFSTVSTDSYTWTVNNMYVRLSTGDMDRTAVDVGIETRVACVIDETQRTPIIPGRVMTELLSLFTARGIRYNAGMFEGIMLRNLTPTILESLPSIQFILQTDDGRHVSIATLSPSEYVSEDLSMLKLKTRIIPSDECLFSPSILQKMVVYFDANTNQIGFGEPLIEL